MKRQDRWDLYAENGHKLASTSPNPMGKLSMKNCQAIERGYDLDELADDFIRCPEDMRTLSEDREINSFKKGFQKALELMGDKKFTKEQMFNVYAYIVKNGIVSGDEINDYIQSLQQTEWDVEIEMEDTFQLKKRAGGITNMGKPKLDADGCLILKTFKSE